MKWNGCLFRGMSLSARSRTVKVWNKTVTIDDVPDNISDEDLIRLTKKRLVQDAIEKRIAG